MITDERYKQLMVDVGMPNSRSLLRALRQVAVEATLLEREACAMECEVNLKSLYLSQGRPASEEVLLVAAVDDCSMAIRDR